MFRRVGAVAHDEVVVVVHELQCCGHLLIGERPIAVLVVEVTRSVLQEHAQRLVVRLANYRRVDVPAPNVCEAADMAEHSAVLIGTLPGNRECADASRTDTADRALIRIFVQFQRMFLHGER